MFSIINNHQAHQDILSCARGGLNACFKPEEVHESSPYKQLLCQLKVLQLKNKIIVSMKSLSSADILRYFKVEAILTVQKAELRTATETVNIFDAYFKSEDC